MRVKLQEGAIMPVRATKNAACYDLFSLETVSIHPGTRKKIRTGVHIELPMNMEATVSHRSGVNTKLGGFAFGRIDSDYRGEIFVTLFNLDSDRPIRIEKGKRFAQMKIAEFWAPILVEVDTLSETKREEGGYGSTGDGKI